MSHDVVELILAGQRRILFLRQALHDADHLAGAGDLAGALATV